MDKIIGRIGFILLGVMLICTSCKDEEPVLDDPTGAGKTDSTAYRYDIKDFDLELFTQAKVVPRKMVTLSDGSILGITLEKDLSHRIVKTNDPYGEWTEIYNNHNVVFDITVDNDGTVYALSQEGLLTTENNGNSWTKKTFEGVNWGTNLQTNATMNLSAVDGNILIARNWGDYSTNDVFFSANKGKTFTKIVSKPDIDHNVVYAIAPDLYFIVTSFNEIRKSTDGIKWETIYTGERTGKIYYDKIDNLLFANFGDLAKVSDNLGETWQTLQGRLIPSMRMTNGDYATHATGQGVFRSNDGGLSWLPLGFIKNGLDGFIEHTNRMVATDGSGIYILEYGKTTWNYIPKNEPSNYYYNYGAHNVYAFNGQLFVREDKQSPWRFTLSFDASEKIVYYTKAYKNNIFVFTQNTFGTNTILYTINSSGTYIKNTEAVPWTGGVVSFGSDGTRIICVFKDGGTGKDFVASRDFLSGTWTVHQMSPKFHTIHFAHLHGASIFGNKSMVLGFEASDGKNYQLTASVLLEDFVNSSKEPQVSNYVDTGWPGLYEYDKIHLLKGTKDFTMAFLDDDMFVGVREGATIKWSKSHRYTTMDPAKKNILRYSAITHEGYPISTMGQYSKPLEVEKIME